MIAKLGADGITFCLRDAIDSGKFHMGNINGITNKICRWLTQEAVEQGNGQSTPESVQSSRTGPASTIVGTRAVQKIH
jgi:hypothetical protein